MPRTADKNDIPQRLTEAGYLLFTRLGYNATGIQQIADEAGVPKGSFYNHFDSKEAFAAVIIRQYTDWVHEAWGNCVSEAPCQAQDDALGVMRYVFERFIRHHEQATTPGCLVGNFAAEVAESSPTCRAVLGSAMQEWRTLLAGLMALGQQQGQIRTDRSAIDLAAFFWDVWEGALLRMKIEHNSQPLKDAVQLMLDHFLRP
ncbi:TetR/AcrR family transcriptional regulator [Aquabacterium sp.]|uniref:TetR/AcrR family transcriptional regulator n=1 Tax=Aquabacterium sp. TaxID=1872578 RepID=UPI002E314ECA|nr:TetR family transcriptional regulator C-terminal domain-containing protein [Aquabacterium sp.]HEX5312428.1 TetR family transcriptional regulator C-terminal domain-containing protein [Aquabacterium sp.]